MGRTMGRHVRGFAVLFAIVAVVIAARSLVFAQPRAAVPARASVPSKAAVQPTDPRVAARLVKQTDLIRPLYAKMAKPKPGEWLAEHAEKGQTFAEYQKVRPAGLGVANKTIYLVKIGPCNEEQAKIIRQTGEFLSIFYGMKVD